jgi:hypothetical protein
MSKVIHEVTDGTLIFYCPGCQCCHAIDKRWKFNNDFEKPTIHPSILVIGNKDKGRHIKRCHSFITNGKIQFLNDSEHIFAGKIVDLEEF